MNDRCFQLKTESDRIYLANILARVYDRNIIRVDGNCLDCLIDDDKSFYLTSSRQDYTAQLLLDEFKGASRVKISTLSCINSTLSIDVYRPHLNTLLQKICSDISITELMSLDLLNFLLFVKRVSGNSGEEALSKGRWSQEYSFEQLLYFVLQIKPISIALYIFPIASTKTIYVYGFINDEGKQKRFELCVYAKNYTNGSDGLTYFDLASGFDSEDRYGKAAPVELEKISKRWKYLATKEPSELLLSQIILEECLINNNAVNYKRI
jgi:hypothetical protein